VRALLETRENESLIVCFDFFIERYSWLISDTRFNAQFAIYVMLRTNGGLISRTRIIILLNTFGIQRGDPDILTCKACFLALRNHLREREKD